MMVTSPEYYLESVLENSPVPLITLDTRLRIAMFNRSAADLTGHDAAAVAGKRVTQLISMRRIREIASLARAAGALPPDGVVTRLKAARGIEIPVRLKVSTLTDSEGSVSGYLVVATDLRELRRLNTQILEAERLAAITETAISVNHEINNPLCSILGNTQLMLLERESLAPGLIHKLEEIESQISRIREIARRLGRITRPVLKDYVGGRKMLDMEHSEVKE